jgi:hypothetical protein
MAKNAEQTATEAVNDLFAQAQTDLDAVGSVGDYIRTGRRWDVTHKEIAGDLIVIHTTKEITTKYGDAALCRIDHQGVEKMCLMGGVVLQDQLKELEPVLPVLAVIRKPARSYVLLDPTPEMVQEYKDKYLS